MSITDKDLHSAASNGDGTYNGLTAMRWLFEAVTGKPMDEAEAKRLFAEAQARRAAK